MNIYNLTKGQLIVLLFGFMFMIMAIVSYQDNLMLINTILQILGIVLGTILIIYIIGWKNYRKK